MRYKLIIEYDGTGFSGFQRQAEVISIQEVIETAIFKFCQERVTLHVAGRTDAGVHALAQVAHFEVPRTLDTAKILGGLNYHLYPHRVAILHVEAAADDFHARFSAKGRAYAYRIISRRAPLTIDADRAWQVMGELDLPAMQQAAQHLIGTFDFSTFRDSDCQGKSPIKTVDALQLEARSLYQALTSSRATDGSVAIHALDYNGPDGPCNDGLYQGREIILTIRARSFLHHMVRNITGSLVQVGLGRWNVEDFIRARDAKDRRAGGPTAPAHGLYFLGVEY
jgi:tRNA pseudouridine38-40 synthase